VNRELSEIVGRPLAWEAAHLAAVLVNLENGPTPQRPWAATAPRPGAKGVIELTGILTPRPSFLNMLFGGTDIESVSAALEAALGDPTIPAISILVDSPGGDVTGVSQLMDQVAAGKSRKPITSYVIGTAASAAYFAISGSTRIVTADTGRLGSIGIVAVAYDDRGLQSRIGVRRFEIVSSHAPDKRPDPSTDQGRAVLQAQVDALEQVFIAKLARNRGVTVDQVLSDFGQGGILVGKDSVRAGLADEVSGVAGAPSNAGNRSGSDGLSIEERCRQAWHADSAVRADFTSIEAYTAYEKAMASGKVKILGKSRAAVSEDPGAGSVNLQRLDPAVRQLPGAGLSLEEQCKQQWAASAEIRAEFRAFNIYLFYMKATAAGKVKITSKSRPL